MHSYKVTCKKCKGSNVIAINDQSHEIYWRMTDRIISGRYRLDKTWGWQCICGNNSLMTQQEQRYITDPVNPDPKEISDIVANLQSDKKKLFEMRQV